MTKPERDIRILLVEDDPGDVLLTEEAFRECCPQCELHVVQDGEAALDHLRRARQKDGLPALILLDLNMPRMDGLEFLDRIRADPVLRPIPVVMLTTSKRPEDVNACYHRHVNSYLVKPVDLDHFFAMIRSLVDFWFEKAVLPSTEEAQAPLAKR